MEKKIGLKEAYCIGVGGMIGGGIFAVLGLSIYLARSAAPLSFLLAGTIALLTGYSYSKLSMRFPSRGGTVEFLIKAFGTGVFTGTLNLLLLMSYIVMLGLYAYAFGAYAANLFHIPREVLSAVAILLFTVINAFGIILSSKTENLLVFTKLAILLGLASAGILFLNTSHFHVEDYVNIVRVIAGGMIIFLAYEGFELIANIGNDIKDVSIYKKAYYLSIISVTLIYVLIAIITIGTLPFSIIIKAKDYVLAIVAKPIFGTLGFLIVSIAALFSTSSAINATLYGTAGISYLIAKYGQLPQTLSKKVWKNSYEGLLIISLLSILLSIFGNLESIATAGSCGFLLIFFFINLAAIKLRNKLKIRAIIPLFGAGFSVLAISILFWNMFTKGPKNILIFMLMILSSFLIEVCYRNVSKREIQEYIDLNLKKREEKIQKWESWLPKVISAIKNAIEDAEVKLLGSIKRGEMEKSTDVDLFVITSKSIEREDVKRIIRSVDKTLENIVDVKIKKKEK